MFPLGTWQKGDRMQPHQKIQWNLGYWLLALLALTWAQSVWQTARTVEAVPYSAFEQALADGRVAEVIIGETTITGTLKTSEPDGKTTIVAKNIGYELRCMDPIPSDLEYTRQLGFCAAKHILESGTQVMVSVQNGRFVPIPYAQMLDPKTGRTRARLVDLSSVKYGIARRFMIRLRKEDFEDAHELAKFAATAGISLDNFRKEFEHVLKFETPPLVFDPAKGSLANRHIEESHKN